MRKIKLLFLILLLGLSIKTTYAQTDSFTIYPNPFSSVAYFNFYLIQADSISINLYNAIGTKIGTSFQDTFFPGGSHTVAFAGDSLKNGIYLVKFIIGKSKIITRQMIKINPTSAIHEKLIFTNDVILFPNPASGDVNIEINNFHDKCIRLNIYDNAGRLVFSENYSGNNFEIATADFESGIYTISIPDLNYNYKLILIK